MSHYKREHCITPDGERCGAQTVFWPDVEACDAECCLPKDHEPADTHEDDILGEWQEDVYNPTRRE